MFKSLPNSLKIAAILTPKQHIFLLSHMRAYTSLLGHILGSNPAVCGYYEMHIGYHSWKSLVRQKLLYFEQDDPKRGFRYMFDKVLHNEHTVSPEVLNKQRTKTIFCLRKPQEAIPSILKLYHDVDPAHEYNSEYVATQYYISRLTMLENIATSLDQDFFYLDAESIKHDSENCLDRLSDWLQLGTRLSPNYNLQKNTSRERYGDSSARLKEGRITGDKSDYVSFHQDAELLSGAMYTHDRVRNTLMRKSASRSVVEQALPRPS